MSMNVEKKRWEYLDALRGLAIILVVAGHLMMRLGISDAENVLWSFIISVHLPLFFFISGLVGNGALLKKVRQLLVPGLLFFVLFRLARNNNPISFVQYGFQEYWFTLVLFEMFFINYVCEKVGGKYKYLMMVCLSLVGVAYLAIPSIRGSRIDVILCIENLAKYFQFFTLGMLCKIYSSTILEWLRKDFTKGGLLVMYVVSFFLCFNNEFSTQYSLLYKLNHDLVLRYVGVLVLFAFFLYKSDLFKTSRGLISRTLTFIGQRTLDIYLIHNFLLPAQMLLPESLRSNEMWYVQSSLLLFLSLLIVGGCLLFSELIRMSPTLSSFLLGTRRR